MKLYKEKFFSKDFIKDSSKYHKYYNDLLSSNKFPKLINSLSSVYTFESKIKDENKDISNNCENFSYSNNSNSIFKKISLKSIKKNKLFLNRMSFYKMKIKPITKRRLIYDDILNNTKSIFSPKFSRNIKLDPLKKILSINSILTKSNQDMSNINHIINFYNDYEKEFFPDIDYLNLKYNEYEIYKNKSVYDDLIKEKIKYFKNNKNENQSIKLVKKFHYGKYKKEINLTLDSMIISLQDMSMPNDEQEKCFQINFPFALLPIFYFKGFETFIKFLSIVIKMENNFEKIIFREHKIYEALNDLKDYQIKNDNEDEEEKKNIGIPNDSHVKEKPKELRPPILKKNKNFLKFNYFIFYWITNTKTYIVKITLPCVHLNIVENNIIINHFIDFELLFYLYKKNFLNWDYYIIKNLSSYSKFRNVFRQIGSFSNFYDKNFFLQETKTKINTFAEEQLINIYTDLFGNNQIILFISFKAIINLVDLKHHEKNIYHIIFNFEQYGKLYEMKKYSSKNFFLLKFLEINNELNTLYFNFKEYDNFDIETWMTNIKKFSGGSLKNRGLNEDLYEEFDIFSKRIKIEFRNPRWSIIKIEGKSEIMKVWEIGKELENDFICCIENISTDSWTNLLNKCLKKVDEPVQLLPEYNIKKRKKKYISDSGRISSRKRTKSKAKVKFI